MFYTTSVEQTKNIQASCEIQAIFLII